MRSLKEINAQYEENKRVEREYIRKQPKRSVRALLWLKYWLLFPFKWLYVNLRDWKTTLIFVIWAALLSLPV